MFGFFDMLDEGKRLQAYGEEWIGLKQYKNRCWLAVKADARLPAQTYLIRVPEDPEEKKRA